MKVFTYIAVLILLVLSISVFSIGGVFAVLGLYVSGYVFYQLLVQEDRWIPIGEIALAMGAFQWIIAPMISYTMPVSMFPMSQNCSQYMAYTVPMFCCFAFGYYRYRKPFLYTVEELRGKCLSARKIAKVFIWIGVIFFLMPINISLLNQISKYISQLMYIGFIIMMIGHPKQATRYFIIPIILTLLMSIQHGMFHELLTWGFILLLIWFKINHCTIQKKLFIILLGLFAVNALQTIKTVYRQETWSGGYGGNKVALFMDLMINSASVNSTVSDEEDDNNSRYNQGWIISKIYDNIPQKHDYFYGSTYKDAFVASLLPRFLAPNKKGSGVQVQSDFMEMTGEHLNDNTSMGLSVLGESYGNFGLFGGALFMAFWGWFIAQIMSLVNKWAKKYGFLWLLMLPIIGFVLVEAEISMITVFNWTVKGFAFVFFVVYLTKSKMKVYK